MSTQRTVAGRRWARPAIHTFARRRAARAALVTIATAAVFATQASGAFAGNFFATGHDEDFHCSAGTTAECTYYKVVTKFVRNGSNLPLLILDRGSDEAVAALNLAYSGSATSTASSPPYVVEDPQGLLATVIHGKAPTGVKTSSKWSKTPLTDSHGTPLWSAIIIASDSSCGGCDLNNTNGPHADSDAINARTSAIHSFFNAGGGLLYLAGASNAFDADGVTGKDVYYASVPVPIGGAPVSAPFTVTAAGAALGITTTMANCCATHNSFTLPAKGSDLQVAETDNAGLAESLFLSGGSVCSTGFCGASTSASCKSGKPCTTTLTTVASSATITAGRGAGGKLTETVDVGAVLKCSHYKAHDANWYGFFETAKNRGKKLLYKLLNTGKNLSTFQFCFGAPYKFKTKSGSSAPKHKTGKHTSEFEGLLPICRKGKPVTAPCISSKKAVADIGEPKEFDAAITVAIPGGLPGDPHFRV